MLIVWLFQLLVGALALICCALASMAILRRDGRAWLALTMAGGLGLIFFLSVPEVRLEMLVLAVIAVVVGVVMGIPDEKRPPEKFSFDSTASRRRR